MVSVSQEVRVSDINHPNYRAAALGRLVIESWQTAIEIRDAWRDDDLMRRRRCVGTYQRRKRERTCRHSDRNGVDESGRSESRF